ncbi:MAG TPA: dihydrodipicolinate synthase family protein [Stellaceae bacterium]|jgi:dihydrodipicolinate synthase/N-acetylneuraminate lyase|nr:dihydrodipicolinate synthase family protein [Stellaceae bacterium]
MMTPSDFRGVYAIIPTPAKPGADRWDAVDTVDLDETARVLNRLIADGVHGLIVLGTTGECATLTPSEYEAFVDCVLQTVKKRIPTFIGTTALGTHEVVRRTRFAAERGADGILLGLPMWQPLTVDMAVEYYRSISEGFPRLALMVYGNHRAFRFAFAPEFWGRVVDVAPTLIAAKFSRPNVLLDCLAVSKGRVHFLPHDGGMSKFAELSPATTTACWSTAASMGPEPVLEQVRALLAHDNDAMKKIAADLAWARQPIAHITSDAELFATYNIQVEKLRIAMAGYCKAGPLRPPYHIMPEPYVASAREHAQRWRQLCEKYAKVPATATH